MLPTSLEILNLAGGNPRFGASRNSLDVAFGLERTPHKFTGGIPSEWGALTNLKELNMARCSLDGKIGSARTERSFFATKIGIVTAQALCRRCFPLRLRFLIWRVAGPFSLAKPRTSSLVESRLNGALLRTSRSS